MDSLDKLPTVDTPLSAEETSILKRYFTSSQTHEQPLNSSSKADSSILKSVIILSVCYIVLTTKYFNKFTERYNPWLITIMKLVIFAFTVFITMKTV